jgi:hypothetical protein
MSRGDEAFDPSVVDDINRSVGTPARTFSWSLEEPAFRSMGLEIDAGDTPIAMLVGCT